MLVHHENDLNYLYMSESPARMKELNGTDVIRDLDIAVVTDWLLDPEFGGILWDNRGLLRVLTRELLQEGVKTYRLAHLMPNAPIAPHVGVFLWDQTISREKADQRGKPRTSESPGPENEPDQRPLES